MTRNNSVLHHATCLIERGFVSALTLSAMLAMLTGCGKGPEMATEKAGQKVVEKMIESAAEKDGGTAKVTTTDANGKKVQMELGGATVPEADLGLPIYPSATPIKGKATKMNSSDRNISLMLNDSVKKESFQINLRERDAGAQVTMISSRGLK
jgi:hypothetical protein